MLKLQKETDFGNGGQPTDEDSEAEQTVRLNPPPSSPPGNMEEMELKKIPVKTDDVGFPEIIGRPSRCCKVEHLRYAVFGLNLVLAILGFVILALAVWIRVDPDFWEYSTSLDIEDFYKACYMFMIAGLIIMMFAFCGCCGALNEVQWMLIIYMVISFAFFVIEVAAVILVWHAPYNKSIRKTLEGTLRRKLDDRDYDESTRYFIDYVQAHLECCGSTGPLDYNATAPASCSNPETGSVFTKGCANVMLNYLQTKAAIIGGIALPILLFHLLSMILTFCVLQDIRIESRYSI